MDSLAHDYQLRALLKAHLSARVTEADLVVDEFSLAYGAVRADLALINGHLEGFEIKAGKDKLDRLAHQVEAYAKVFEFSWVVTTPAHLSNVRALVPMRWGLLVASVEEDGACLRQLRKAQRNAMLDGAHLVRLLWRDEVLAKLDELDLSTGLKSKPSWRCTPPSLRPCPSGRWPTTCVNASNSAQLGELMQNHVDMVVRRVASPGSGVARRRRRIGRLFVVVLVAGGEGLLHEHG